MQLSSDLKQIVQPPKARELCFAMICQVPDPWLTSYFTSHRDYCFHQKYLWCVKSRTEEDAVLQKFPAEEWHF